MSETKFTSGPWQPLLYSTTVNGKKNIFAFEVNGGKDLNVNITPKKDVRFPCCDFKNELIANAHLIAAAPEMYSALLLAMESIDPNNKEALDICNSALAKARGEL